MNKTKHTRIPLEMNSRIMKVSELMKIPSTKVFRIQEKFLFGDFKLKTKKHNGKRKYFIEIEE